MNDVERNAIYGYIKIVCANDLAAAVDDYIELAVDKHVSVGKNKYEDNICMTCGYKGAEFTVDWIEEPESGSILQLASAANDDVLKTEKDIHKEEKQHAYRTTMLNKTKAAQIEDREKWFRRIKNALLNKKEN